MVSVHIFTPALKNGPHAIGKSDIVNYRDEHTGRAMLRALAGSGWVVGDQKHHPDTLFNATPGRPGKVANIPSLVGEVRQDHLVHSAVMERIVDGLGRAIDRVQEAVG